MSRTRRLWIVLCLNLGLVTMLVITGLAAHSLAIAVIISNHALRLLRKITAAIGSTPAG